MHVSGFFCCTVYTAKNVNWSSTNHPGKVASTRLVHKRQHNCKTQIAGTTLQKVID